MKRNWKSLLAMALAAGLLAGGAVTAGAAEKAGQVEAVDMDSFTAPLPADYSKPQLQPISGWFTRSFEDGRTVKMLVPENTPLRARFIIMALPAGVDAWGYLSENGWAEKAEEYNTCLYILEAGENGWGTAQEEEAYMAEAMGGILSASNGNRVSLVSTHGTFAVIGFEGGCEPLEAWVVENPLYVYAQAYVGGHGADDSYRADAQAHVYDENFDGNFKLTPEQFDFAMDTLGLTREDAITKADITIPAWFAGCENSEASIEYWKNANDCLAEPDENGIFHEDVNSDSWQTVASNENIRRWEPDSAYGLSEVRVTDTAAATTDELFAFTAKYTSYTAVCAYSNNLAPFSDYHEAVDAAIASCESGAKRSFAYTNHLGEEAAADLYALESTHFTYDRCAVEGTIYVGSLATVDFDGDGVQDPQEIVLYVPDTAFRFGEEGAPVVLVHPGMAQTAETFVACSGWIPVANDEGCVCLFVGEPYFMSTMVGYTSISKNLWDQDVDSIDFARAMVSFLKEEVDPEYVNLDFTRLYMSGHSGGSFTSQNLAFRSEKNYVAAIGTTSMMARADGLSDGIMPAYLFYGQTDVHDQNADFSVDPWCSTPNEENAPILFNLLNAVMEKDQLGISLVPDDEEAFYASCTSLDVKNTRFLTYSWANEQGIELLKLNRTLLREHNSIPQEFRKIYDYVKQFRLVTNEDGSQTRLYSPSGFAEDDAVEIQ